jgi:hypothetical protein
MPNLIDKETYKRAYQELPDTNRLRRRIACLSPDFISSKYEPKSIFPVASVCFQDASRVLSESLYAMHESLAYKIWNQEKKEGYTDITRIYFSKFYADDTALRLYSAAEHLAKAVICIFEIPDSELISSKARSRLNKVREILTKEEPTHKITTEINKLYDFNEWKQTIRYRNEWVHQQPPLVEGLGISFQRKLRWVYSKADKNYKLAIGKGDEAKYSIDDLHGFIFPALIQFIDTMTQISEFYISELVKKGFSLNEEQGGLQLKFP